jgi:hypothetical protein
MALHNVAPIGHPLLVLNILMVFSSFFGHVLQKSKLQDKQLTYIA